MLEWDDVAKAERQMEDDERRGQLWLLDTSTGDVLMADAYSLAERRPIDGYRPLRDIGPLEMVDALREALNG